MIYKNKWIRLFIAVFALIALATSAQAQLKRPNPGFYRMQKFGELRCGYVDHPPYIQTDYLTGDVQGPFADIAENMVGYLHVKVKWVKEDSLANIVTSLNDNKYEVFCGFLPYDTELANHLQLTNSIMDLPHYVYAKGSDERFTDSTTIAELKDMTAYVEQGSLSHLIANSYLPDVKLALTGKKKTEEFLTEFLASDADLLLGDPAELDAYMKQSSEDLQIIVKDPLAITSVTYAISNQNDSLVKLINGAIQGVHVIGKTDAIFLEYDMDEDVAQREQYKDLYGDRIDTSRLPPCAVDKDTRRPTDKSVQEIIGADDIKQTAPDSCSVQ